MSDGLVDRLLINQRDIDSQLPPKVRLTCAQAADRITELETENKRLTGLVMLQGGPTPSEEQRHAIVAEYLEVSDE